ncbi:MAG: energy transducer TonB [Chitinophagaceae bacterium]|nr:energy transducer TonB [Chitinophagaceae bacterium]
MECIFFTIPSGTGSLLVKAVGLKTGQDEKQKCTPAYCRSSQFLYIYRMKHHLLFFLLLLCFRGIAQDTIACYFDEQLALTGKKHAVYAGSIVAQPDGWEALAYYQNGAVLMHGFFADKKLKIKQGAFTLFYPDGNRRAATSFSNNETDGVYMGWHPNGLLSDSGVIRQQMRSGAWKTWYINGVLESAGAYADGAPDGEWRWYHPNGKPSTIEIYSNNKLDDLTCYDTLGLSSGSNCRIEKKPCPEGAYDFETYITDSLYYPPEALKKKIEGEVSFEFLISKEGRLAKINFTNEANVLLQDEVVRLLKSVKRWEPAVSHNRAVDYLYSYSAPFYLPE